MDAVVAFIGARFCWHKLALLVLLLVIGVLVNDVLFRLFPYRQRLRSAGGRLWSGRVVVVYDVLDPIFEFTQRLAEGSAQFRQLLRSEQEQRDYDNEYDMAGCK
ncbi:MAG: hypothetical protein K0R75_3927 [Paenibacillaceae bacterium]|jgi:hypothetical protein|nr:hypothetical protein [Paenibacillaceae bacterium]